MKLPASLLALAIAFGVPFAPSAAIAAKATPAKAAAAASADAQFAKAFGSAWFDRYWRYNPDFAVASGYYQAASRLQPFDAAFRAEYLHFLISSLGALEQIDSAKLSADKRTDWALLKTQLESERWHLTELKPWQWNPALYNVAESIALLLNTEYAPLNQRLQAIDARLKKVSDYYVAAVDSLGTPTLEHTQLAYQQNEGALEVIASVEEKIAASSLSPTVKARMQNNAFMARRVVADYRKWLKAKEEQLLRDGNARSFRLGAEAYEVKFGYDIQSGGSAEALYQRALNERDRLHAKMSEAADLLWPKYMADQAKPADAREKIGQLIQKLSAQHTSPEQFIPEVQRQIPLLEAWVREKNLLTLDPEKPLRVRETPKYLRGTSIASINSPGPYDPKANTYYNVSPLDAYTPEQAESFLREYNDWILQILNIHEAVPGHYLQLIYANKSKSLIKSVFGNGAMVEGWAVYSERMMLESGYGGNTPEFWLMYAKWNLRVVCNTILDYGVHVLGMSEADALKLLMGDAFQSETEARGKWRRVQLSHVQLTSYFAGYSAIYDFRERLKAEQGDQFSLKGFHEQFLSYGSAPVAVIQSLMAPKAASAPANY